MEQVTTTTETPSGSPFQQALAATRAETSAPPEQSPAAAASPEPIPASPPNEPPAPASEPLAAATPTDELISDTELAALETQHANDPKALVKSLKGAWTKKTQAHSKLVKEAEAKIAFADNFNADPVGTVTKLGQAAGLSVKPTAAERQETATQQTAQSIAAAGTAKLVELLGPELGAEFGQVLRSVAEETAKSVVAPLTQAQRDRDVKSADENMRATHAAFVARHPDWQTHEPKMLALGKRLLPADGADLGEYMDGLYNLATMDARIASGVQAQIEKMTKGAQAAETATRTVPDSAIQVAPRKIRNFRDAYEDTKAEQARDGAR